MVPIPAMNTLVVPGPQEHERLKQQRLDSKGKNAWACIMLTCYLGIIESWAFSLFGCQAGEAIVLPVSQQDNPPFVNSVFKGPVFPLLFIETGDQNVSALLVWQLLASWVSF